MIYSHLRLNHLVNWHEQLVIYVIECGYFTSRCFVRAFADSWRVRVAFARGRQTVFF